MAETLEDLKAKKIELDRKLAEAQAEFKAKVSALKSKIVFIDGEIFKREEGFFAATARKVASQHPEFMKLVQAEIEKAELEATTKPAGAKKGRPKTKAGA